MFCVDFPFSIILSPIVWWYVHPLLWFGVVGTLWGYLLTGKAWVPFNRFVGGHESDRSNCPVAALEKLAKGGA
jgi:hypothetical protein